RIQRKLHDKRCASAYAVAMRFNRTSMHVDDRFYDVQPEPQASGALALFVLLELIEDVGQKLRTDPLTLVLDRDGRHGVVGSDARPDGFPNRSELDGVGEKIPDNLSDPAGIALHGQSIGRD